MSDANEVKPVDAIEIRPMTSMTAIREIEPVQRMIWDREDIEVIPAHTFHALAQNGGSLFGAYDGAKLVGFVLGVLGTVQSPQRIDQVAAARLKMYSVIAGVLAEYQGRGIGYRLKMAQREFALRVGVRLITWTYDPLESLNGRFNIGKLGAVCHHYLRHFHGDMTGLNAGLPTDRFEAEWWVTSNRVEGRAVRGRRGLSLDALLGGGSRLLNETSANEDGLPVPPDRLASSRGGNLLLVEIPSRFQEIKRRDFDLALHWRLHTRQIFEKLFQENYMVTDFVFQQEPEGRGRSFYLLTHNDS
jgi:predicted GNAT superfamily acetyltransferase